ncbi:MAG: twin-arginine translocase subunit TatC [Alloprevotella sp.]|nr:twin-arginine translocase subunit TatC [Alloprevotella sp.]
MSDEPTMNFWEHLEELRSTLIRALLAVIVAGVVCFMFKEPVFRLVLAPAKGNFFFLDWIGIDNPPIHLVNTQLTEQFMVHMKVALVCGLIVASPYVIYQLFRFVAPALYDNERRYSSVMVVASFVLFMVGVTINYLLIFPLTVRFLGTYQVDASVQTMLTLNSYIDTLLLMCLMFGLMFEIPALSWLLAKIGVLRAEWMSRYRRHAIVVILIVAAIITPTTDAFTLMIVSLPIWLLYEASIGIVKISQKKQ